MKVKVEVSVLLGYADRIPPDAGEHHISCIHPDSVLINSFLFSIFRMLSGMDQIKNNYD